MSDLVEGPPREPREGESTKLKWETEEAREAPRAVVYSIYVLISWTLGTALTGAFYTEGPLYSKVAFAGMVLASVALFLLAFVFLIDRMDVAITRVFRYLGVYRKVLTFLCFAHEKGRCKTCGRMPEQDTDP